MGKPRLPWKRGPAAWKVKTNSDEILKELADTHRGFFTLRRAARLFRLSTQPLRDWTKSGYLSRKGPRLQYDRAHLRQFVEMLRDRAEPFEPQNYERRFYTKIHRRVFRFAKLGHPQILWPRNRPSLGPAEIARLAHCHPSLIRQAIYEGEVKADRPTPFRWRIYKKDWVRAFPCSIVGSSDH